MSKLLEPSELAAVGPVEVLTPAHDLAGRIPAHDAGQGRGREQPRPRRRGMVAGPAMALAAVAVLLLALLAGVAVRRAGAPGPAVAVADPAAAANQAAAVVPGFIELHEDQRPPVTVAAPALAAAYTGACRSDLAGCVPEERLVPGVPAPTTPVGTGRQQAELYAIEVRDNGAGTTGGDSGSCRSPGASCDR